jgi:hypothetical protein
MPRKWMSRGTSSLSLPQVWLERRCYGHRYFPVFGARGAIAGYGPGTRRRILVLLLHAARPRLENVRLSRPSLLRLVSAVATPGPPLFGTAAALTRSKVEPRAGDEAGR